MEDFTVCPFTQFTRNLLSRSALAQPIYHLQHESGFNVNIILYFLWLAKECYGRLTKRNVRDLQTQIMLWHQRVIAELKYTHALLGNHTDSVSVNIKHLLEEEIAKAHLIEQCMIYDSKIKTRQLRRTPHQQLTDACTSMIYYCELKNDLLIEADQIAYAQLAVLVFDMLPKAAVEQEVTQAFDQLKTTAGKPVQLMWDAI